MHVKHSRSFNFTPFAMLLRLCYPSTNLHLSPLLHSVASSAVRVITCSILTLTRLCLPVLNHTAEVHPSCPSPSSPSPTFFLGPIISLLSHAWRRLGVFVNIVRSFSSRARSTSRSFRL